MVLFLTVLVISCIIFGGALQISETKIVQIKDGRIQGRQLSSFQNNTYYAFQQIPYAAPPVGEYRLQVAREPRKWSGILNTTENTKVCIQFQGNGVKEDEDCLYLNVYTPADPESETELLPVWFWIHGGVFLKGDGSFDRFGPQYIMDYNVVLVTINYRLGPLGFAYTYDNVIPGNIGLKDQAFALKWVQDNIASFKGDPRKVTIAGQSAGAGAVGYHLLSPISKGLFRAAIQESGSSLCSKMFQKDPQYFTIKLAEGISPNLINTNSSQELLRVLKNADIEELKKQSSALQIPQEKWNCAGSYGSTVWNPVIELNKTSAFISKPMEYTFKQGNLNSVPVLIGFNSEEEMHFDISDQPSKTSYFDKDESTFVNGNVNISPENKRKAGEALKPLYTNDSFHNNLPGLIKLISDVKYTNGICRQADLQSMFSDVYFYIFSYTGLINKSQVIDKVGHTEELKYIFVNKLEKEPDWKPLDREIQKKILTLWTNFVKLLNPTPKQHPLSDGFIWKKMDRLNFNYMNLDERLEMKKDPRQYSRWKEIFEIYAEKVQETF